MRRCLAVLAWCIGIVSILLTARYGWKQADEEIDKWVAAVMFGSISLCAFVFDAVAVRLWFNRLRGISVFIGLIAALAFIVTFTNSLGGIASRAERVEAQRYRILDTRNDDRRELERLEKQLAELGNYAPTDQAAVDAAARAADSASMAKERECGNGDPKQRGKFCREKEDSERNAADALRKTTAQKATTDRASKLEGEIRAVRDHLSAGETVATAKSSQQCTVSFNRLRSRRAHCAPAGDYCIGVRAVSRGPNGWLRGNGPRVEVRARDGTDGLQTEAAVDLF